MQILYHCEILSGKIHVIENNRTRVLKMFFLPPLGEGPRMRAGNGLKTILWNHVNETQPIAFL
jgi:hypothetical protein